MFLDELDKFYSKNELKENMRILNNLPSTFNEFAKEGLYIYGDGLLGKFAIEQMRKAQKRIIGIITSDNSKVGSSYQDIPYVRNDDLGNGFIIICSFHYLQIQGTLNLHGYSKFLYYELLPLIYDEIQAYYIGFNSNYWDVLLSQKEKIRDFFELIQHDDLSVQVLNDVLMYRITFDSKYLDHAFSASVEKGVQYFDKDIIKLTSRETFVDCGGFDGETSESFIKEAHNMYKEIFLFEPDCKIIENTKIRMKNYDNIRFMPFGIGEKEEQLRFSVMGSNGGGAIGQSGDYDIKVVSLNKTLKNVHPSYIKMDIEGSEKEALRGAEEIIRREIPKMAISIYHHPEDIVEIVDWIGKLNLNYKFYVRHYSRNYADTVLYCIPEKYLTDDPDGEIL